MKIRLALAAALFTGFVAAASAADMPVKAGPIPVATGYDWTGWQFGFGIGTSWNRARWGDTVTPNVVAHNWDEMRLSLHGVHQYQLTKFGLGNLVLGLEYTMSFGNPERVGVSACPNPAFNCETSIDLMMTSGVRIGWGFDRFMIYGSGGLARGEVNSRFIVVAGGATLSPDAQWHNGFYVGGGFDWLIHKGTGIDLILGAEYQHIDLGTDRHFLPGGAVALGFTRDVTMRQDVVRGKLTVKFNGPSFLGL
jgi:outer membrane immunogenic protein